MLPDVADSVENEVCVARNEGVGVGCIVTRHTSPENRNRHHTRKHHLANPQPEHGDKTITTTG